MSQLEKTIKKCGTQYLHQERFTTRAWMAKYGCSVLVISVIWGLIQQSPKSHLVSDPVHLLWMLYWLKVYPTWDEFSSTIQISVKTGRQKVYLLLAICYDVLMVSSIVRF
jgi:hypothetical protein